MALSNIINRGTNILAWFDFKPQSTCVVNCQISKGLSDYLTSKGLKIVNAKEENYKYAILTTASSNISEEIRRYHQSIDPDGAVFVIAENLAPRALEAIKINTGIPCHVYIPYPDVWDVIQIFEESHMPSHDELRDILPFKSASKIRNPRLLVFYKTEPAELMRTVKFNEHRGRKFRINTYVMESRAGLRVIKRAANPESVEHLRKIVSNQEILQRSYNSIVLAGCRSIGEGMLEFPYVDGCSLIAGTNVASDPIEKIKADLDNALKPILDYDPRQVTNLDCDIDNFKAVGDKVVCIDYEWVTRQHVPVAFARFRAVYHFYYLNKNVLTYRINQGAFLKMFGFSAFQQFNYRLKELVLQLRIRGILPMK
ncbi:MAG: hypothetical protein J6127_08825 [Clostridiales bacterium]|nr:hypothetical protein [Clostridiales bacterium]